MKYGKKTKYTIRMFSLFHILTVLFLIAFGCRLAVSYFNPVTGTAFVLAGLFKFVYMAVWKLEFDTDTGECMYRNLFRGRQTFHVSEIGHFYISYSRSDVNRQFVISVDGKDIRIPAELSPPLQQYLEFTERRKKQYRKS